MRSLATTPTLIGLLAACCFADLGVEQAWELAQKHSDVPLSREPERWGYPPPGADSLRFATAPGQRPARTHEVNPRAGTYDGFVEVMPDAKLETPMTDGEAIELGKQLASRHVPEIAPLLQWRVESYPRPRDPMIVVRGEVVPPAGAPRGPVSGCDVRCDVETGTVVQYLQILHTPDAPAPVQVQVTAERALEIARERLRAPGAALDEAPFLWQANDGVEWHVRLGLPDDRHALVWVAANTGKVKKVGWYVGAATEPSPAAVSTTPASGPPCHPTPWLAVLALGAGLVALPPLAGLLLRRRTKT